MWLLTPFGFFSVVNKPGDAHLTVRSRVRADLDALRSRYLPGLSATRAGEGTDYPYRATCSHEDFAQAQAQLCREIDYNNFKGKVGELQGQARARIYGEVWQTLTRLESLEKEEVEMSSGKWQSFGGVLFDEDGRVLLRRPKGDFDGGKWTFAKGRPSAGESPKETALREVREETGYVAEILAPIPGAFEGTSSVNQYFLMRPVRETGDLDWETESIRWATLHEARTLIAQSPSATKRQRDLAVLEAASLVLDAR